MKKIITMLILALFIVGTTIAAAQEFTDPTKDPTLDSIFLFKGWHSYLNSVETKEAGVDKFLQTYLEPDTQVTQMIKADIEEFKDELTKLTSETGPDMPGDLLIKKEAGNERVFPNYPKSSRLEFITYHLDQGLYQFSDMNNIQFSPFDENGQVQKLFIYFDLDDQLIFISDYAYIIDEETTYLTIDSYQMNPDLDTEAITQQLNQRGVNNQVDKRFYSTGLSFKKLEEANEGLKGNFIRLHFTNYEEYADEQKGQVLLVLGHDYYGNEAEFILLLEEAFPDDFLEDNPLKIVEGELTGLVDFAFEDGKEKRLPQIEVHHWGTRQDYDFR